MASTMQILMNPAKMVLGKGTAIKLRGTPKSLVHIKSSKGNFALCGAAHPSNYKSQKNRRKIVTLEDKKPVVTCYRCIKLFRMGPKTGKEPGTGLLAQKLRFPGNKQEHYLIPGGRQGRKVSGTKKYTRKVRAERFEEGFGPFTLKGTFRGPKSHPTQSRMLPTRTKSARKRATYKPIAARKASKQIPLIANPHYFGMGYSKGTKDYRSAVPTPASTLKQRSMSYQRGYLEGYADAADKKTVRANPKKRKTYAWTDDGKPGRYKVVEGFDHYNGKRIYHVVGVNNNYVGEWHTSKASAQRELKATKAEDRYDNPKKRKNPTKRRNTRAKTYVYDSWGETIFFAEDLGFKYTANDEEDPDGLEDDAIRFIESKGYKVVGYDSNPRKRRNTRKRSNPKTKRFRKADGTFGYMVGGKFATKRKYDAAKKRR